jgi:hypothetical protein
MAGPVHIGPDQSIGRYFYAFDSTIPVVSADQSCRLRGVHRHARDVPCPHSLGHLQE